MIQFHTSVFQSLKHSATWAAIAGALGGIASQVPAPHSAHCAVASGACAIVAAVIKSPNDGIDSKPGDNNDSNPSNT